MFDPIQGPADLYSGPATGLTTEKGDSWHVAVSKINAGFKKVIAALESPFAAENVAIVDDEARKEIAELRETVSAMQITLDAIMTPATPPITPDPEKPLATLAAAEEKIEPPIEGVEGTASNG